MLIQCSLQVMLSLMQALQITREALLKTNISYKVRIFSSIEECNNGIIDSRGMDSAELERKRKEMMDSAR